MQMLLTFLKRVTAALCKHKLLLTSWAGRVMKQQNVGYAAMLENGNTYEMALMWEATDNKSNLRIQQILILINRGSNAFTVLWAANM
jgi:hypothetical protein